MSLALAHRTREVPLILEATPSHLNCHAVRGKQAILALRDDLQKLGARCGQTGAMDYIGHFLDSPDNTSKNPHLVLVSSESERGSGETLVGAALLYEYRLSMFPCRIFATDDGTGSRTVIAPQDIRGEVAVTVCRFLMDRGARIVLLSYKGGASRSQADDLLADVLDDRRQRSWALQPREISTYLPLSRTIEGTLASLGKHTRRNLRHFLRKAESELGCKFFPDATVAMDLSEIFTANHSSTHPVDDLTIRWRWETLRKYAGSFCAGVRAQDGSWLSLLGGRRHHGTTEVDWQMNRVDMDRYSLGTVMRSCLLQHEVELGTERLHFEGGTPHSMRHSLISEEASDIVVMRRRSVRVSLLRRFGSSILPEKNFLMQTLRNKAIDWKISPAVSAPLGGEKTEKKPWPVWTQSLQSFGGPSPSAEPSEAFVLLSTVSPASSGQPPKCRATPPRNPPHTLSIVHTGLTPAVSSAAAIFAPGTLTTSTTRLTTACPHPASTAPSSAGESKRNPASSPRTAPSSTSAAARVVPS